MYPLRVDFSRSKRVHDKPARIALYMFYKASGLSSPSWTIVPQECLAASMPVTDTLYGYDAALNTISGTTSVVRFLDGSATALAYPGDSFVLLISLFDSLGNIAFDPTYTPALRVTSDHTPGLLITSRWSEDSNYYLNVTIPVNASSGSPSLVTTLSSTLIGSSLKLTLLPMTFTVSDDPSSGVAYSKSCRNLSAVDESGNTRLLDCAAVSVAVAGPVGSPRSPWTVPVFSNQDACNFCVNWAAQGTYQVALKYAGESIASSPYSVTVIGAVSASQSFVTGLPSELLVAAGTSFSFTLHTRDLFGVVFDGISTTQASSSFDPPMELSRGDFVRSTSVNSSAIQYTCSLCLSRSYSLRVAIAGEPVIGSPFPVTVVPGQAAPSNSFLKLVDSLVYAGVYTEAVLRVQDACGNSVNNPLGYLWDIAITRVGGGTEVFATRANASQIHISFPPLYPGDHIISCSLSGSACAGSPIRFTALQLSTVPTHSRFVSGLIGAGNMSFVTPSAQTVTAGLSFSIGIVPVDAWGVVISNYSFYDAFRVAITSAVAFPPREFCGAILKPDDCTNVIGCRFITLSSLCVPAGSSPALTPLLRQGSSIGYKLTGERLHNGYMTVYRAGAVDLIWFDQAGNVLCSMRSTGSLNIAGGIPCLTSQPTVYRFRMQGGLKASRPGKWSYAVQLPCDVTDFLINFDSIPPSVQGRYTCDLAEGINDIRLDATCDFSRVQRAFYFRLSWSMDGEPLHVIAQSSLLYAEPTAQSPAFTVNIISPGIATSARWLSSIYPYITFFGTSISFRVQLLDAFGVELARSDTTALWQIAVSPTVSNGMINITDNGDGTLTIEWLPSVASEYVLYLTVRGYVISRHVAVLNPLVTCSPHIVIAGTNTTCTSSLFDAAGSGEIESYPVVQMQLMNNTGHVVASFADGGKVTINQVGNYSVNATGSSWRYAVTGVTVRPAGGDPSSLMMTRVSSVNGTVSFNLTSYDIFGNVQEKGGDVFRIIFTDTSTTVEADVVDYGIGIYGVIAEIPQGLRPVSWKMTVEMATNNMTTAPYCAATLPGSNACRGADVSVYSNARAAVEIGEPFIKNASPSFVWDDFGSLVLHGWLYPPISARNCTFDVLSSASLKSTLLIDGKLNQGLTSFDQDHFYELSLTVNTESDLLTTAHAELQWSCGSGQQGRIDSAYLIQELVPIDRLTSIVLI